MDCSPPGPSVHGILQARILEWVAISCSSGSSQRRNRIPVSCIAGRFFTNWATNFSSFRNLTKSLKVILRYKLLRFLSCNTLHCWVCFSTWKLLQSKIVKCLRKSLYMSGVYAIDHIYVNNCLGVMETIHQWSRLSLALGCCISQPHKRVKLQRHWSLAVRLNI